MAAGLALLVACGEDEKEKPVKRPVRPVVVTIDATTTDAFVEAAPAAPIPFGGERIEISELPKLKDQLPSVVFASALTIGEVKQSVFKGSEALNVEGLALKKQGNYGEAKKKFAEALAIYPGHLLARYNLASSYVLAGEGKKGLSLLHQIFTAKNCQACTELVVRVTSDSDWKELYSSSLFYNVIGAWLPYAPGCDDNAAKSEKSCPPLWWQEGGVGCPPPTKRKGKVDETGEGEIWCAKPNGDKHGPYRLFEIGTGENGEGSRTTLTRYKDGGIDGSFRSFVKGGESIYKYERDGKLVGASTIKDSGSITKFSVVFADREAHWEYHSKYGTIVSRSESVNGKKHGPHLRWAVPESDPKWRILIERGTYREDKKHGEWITYFEETGHPLTLISYDDGIPHGSVTYWDTKGEKLGATTMDHGNGEWLEYDRDGKVLAMGIIADGNKDGPWVDGNNTGAYKDGKRDGEWTYLNSDGSVLTKGVLINGLPSGVWKLTPLEGDEIEYEFKKGRLVKQNGKKVSAKKFDYNPEQFAAAPGKLDPAK